ncbi:MAG: anthranilate synthase component I family protein [Chitinophagales bacterium]|nr:anthranilate synthase component I family protein [Chitinophagales bacterium]
MRQKADFPVEDLVYWKNQLLYWAASHTHAAYLDSHQHDSAAWECLVAVGVHAILEAPAGAAFDALGRMQKEYPDWLFGFFSYDLKNELEQLHSHHPDGVGLPDLGFFCPETVVSIKKAEGLYQMEIACLSGTPEEKAQQIAAALPTAGESSERVTLQARIPRDIYLQTVEAIRQHIAGGDIYEMNFCQEFYAESVTINPLEVYQRLKVIGKAPFSCFLRWNDRYLLSASPERFLRKNGQKLLSQPIKGTRKRGASAAEDEQIRAELAASEKDRSENVMIVDLVRNDFSRNCVPGTVVVEELCGIHTFATVHQMISTVSGQLPDDKPETALRALRDCFPMGSMTGAPKVMAMELIEHFEKTRRGLYSGAVGYFNPEGDFDFNVVIRSILYHAGTGYCSAQVGGAIVYDSDPVQEYEECLVKVDAMVRALKDS